MIYIVFYSDYQNFCNYRMIWSIVLVLQGIKVFIASCSYFPVHREQGVWLAVGGGWSWSRTTKQLNNQQPSNDDSCGTYEDKGLSNTSFWRGPKSTPPFSDAHPPVAAPLPNHCSRLSSAKKQCEKMEPRKIEDVFKARYTGHIGRQGVVFFHDDGGRRVKGWQQYKKPHTHTHTLAHTHTHRCLKLTVHKTVKSSNWNRGGGGESLRNICACFVVEIFF